jgi:DNA-directed RNA polymerase subunit M/transcription elongation factor TFIIS
MTWRVKGRFGITPHSPRAINGAWVARQATDVTGGRDPLLMATVNATEYCTDGLRHHWLIEEPNGPTSLGTCKRCGTERRFRNSVQASRWRTIPDTLEHDHAIQVFAEHTEGGGRPGLGVLRTCKTCGEVFYARASKTDAQFCSRACMAVDEEWRQASGSYGGKRMVKPNTDKKAEKVESGIESGLVQQAGDEKDIEKIDTERPQRSVEVEGKAYAVLPATLEELVSLWYEDQSHDVIRSALLRSMEDGVRAVFGSNGTVQDKTEAYGLIVNTTMIWVGRLDTGWDWEPPLSQDSDPSKS